MSVQKAPDVQQREKSAYSLDRLVVWQRGVDLVEEIYRLTQNFPSSERFGLISQLRRAAVSIPSNIAEGHARTSRKEFLQFLSQAYGSTAEVYTQLVIAGRVGLLTEQNGTRALGLLHETQRLLLGMIRAMRQSA